MKSDAMKDIIKVDTIDRYNQLFGLQTLHPLVAVVDLSKAPKWPEHFCFNYGFYCLYVKDAKCGKNPDLIRNTPLEYRRLHAAVNIS